MCLNGEASAVLATVGLSNTAYFYYCKKESPVLYTALEYFSFFINTLHLYLIPLKKLNKKFLLSSILCVLLVQFYSP